MKAIWYAVDCRGRGRERLAPGPRPRAPRPAAKESVIVTIAPVATRAVERTVSVVGTLAANMQADVASEVEGQVTAIEADLGDRVAKDQALARVRSDVLEAKLREAEASFEKTQADEARGRPLRDEGIISVQEYEQVRTALAVAKARREQLNIEVERAVIRAPFDGSIAARPSTRATTCTGYSRSSGSSRTTRSSSAARCRSARCRRCGRSRRYG
jgi:multidrug efflux pump subunit AcrA (membrane-fusion protein)